MPMLSICIQRVYPRTFMERVSAPGAPEDDEGKVATTKMIRCEKAEEMAIQDYEKKMLKVQEETLMRYEKEAERKAEKEIRSVKTECLH